MNRQAAMAMQLAFACMLLVSLNGCLKDNYAHAYTLYQPIYMTLTEARADEEWRAAGNRITGKIEDCG